MASLNCSRRRFLQLAAGAAALPAVSRIARAQAYPTRPVRLVVGTPPAAAGHSGAADRAMAVGAARPAFVIDNRPGAGTNIATEAVVQGARRRLHALSSTSSAINATLYPKLSFNFIRDIAPVAGIVPSRISWW